MNVNQANNLDFPDLLARMGFLPVSRKKEGRELWYRSPFRAEKEPSFHISRGYKYKWVWKDFGDIGGTLIDFVMRYHQHQSLKQALQYLESIYGKKIQPKSSSQSSRIGEQQNTLFSFHGQEAALPPDFSEDRELEFIEAKPVQHPAIISYLTDKRAIPPPLIDRYLQEVHYLNKKTSKKFFAFGMENRSGGYEIRAASDKYSFKSALISRDVTFIKGAEPQRKAVNIFEGMTDFLSLLAMYGIQELAGDTIVMHSLSSFDRGVELIKGMGFETIFCFLDNDDSGKKFTAKFQEEFGSSVEPKNYLFEPYKDLNAALVANQFN